MNKKFICPICGYVHEGAPADDVVTKRSGFCQTSTLVRDTPIGISPFKTTPFEWR